ncbi:long-chain fatty acid--CoA ligase [Actinomadura barringtoniae]|uniref:Long-chain fatty acid--CoA ligase n=1 Tax=Actinomadura barringtoniae TaxID=1427535 RepID=A0A939PIT2_9ACTN|nr:fatty acid--CoA ligase family protein [Actinomadura barringtoniae]MBO2453687.1 long-chain fatty acid--CoA ligase [Actinomadura barringtoniae]
MRPVLEALRAHPDRPAFEHGGRVVTRAELRTMAFALATGMRSAGLGPGSGVALATDLTPETFAAHLAAHALGCRVAGARPGWSPAIRAHALKAGDFDAVLDTDRLEDLAAQGRSASRQAAPVEVRPDDIARLNFTSGTTGRPKACARTYATFDLDFQSDRWSPDLAALIENCGRFLAFESWAPPVMLTFAGRCLLIGGTVVIADGANWAPVIERHRVTALAMPVPFLQRLPAGLDSLRAVVVTGSPASPTLLSAAMDRLGPILWQGYGQAESGMISLFTPAHLDALGSVGRPLQEVEVAVHAGEIHVRSPHAMAGYWGEPERTREVLSEDGWLRTHDLGRVDGDGYLWLDGRTRDIVIVNAEICYAGAIERALASHPDVAQAFVVGVPDERTGEAVHAFVIPSGAEPPDPAALATLVRSELTANSVPRTITAVREVPLSPTGKPDKTALARLIDPDR